MPPFVDHVQFQEAVSHQALPVLEAIAANDNLRSLRRFERDDPPPYVSSTESEELDPADLIPPPRGRPMPEELKAIMERPFDDDELNDIAFSLENIVYPDWIYYKEAWSEDYRLDMGCRGPLPQMFRGMNGSRREGVIVRHNVKRRWEKLGVWNPEWGFAGRKMQPEDYARMWKWTWQQHDRPDGYNPIARDLVARALRLRRNLRRGEHAPMLPRSHPGQDTTVAQAEAFLISRPWFIFAVESAEEWARYYRLSIEDRRRYPYSSRSQVIKWWRERGDWRDEFNRKGSVTAWKWRHESPSPEPEDLTPVGNMQDSPLGVAEEMGFTPSEIDELETIELPESEQPEGFWALDEQALPPFFPGQRQDADARITKQWKERMEENEKAKAEGREPPFKWGVERFNLGPLFGGSPQAVQHKESSPGEHEASIELQEDASEPQREAACPPPQKRRRLHRHQTRDGVDGAQDQDQPLSPPSRRSARIAGMKRPAEPPPSQTAPNKRPRRGAAPEATASAARPTSQETRRTRTRLVPTRPPPKEKTETQPKRGPGRPRKERMGTETQPKRGRGRPKKNGLSMRSAVRKRPARTPAPAEAGSGSVVGTNVPGVPRRRGRPRKYE